ncbi:MAG: hypothetical protein LUD25_02465 [Coriobacteriaceae bacterium]|nr:hypothetical protein [Coriobacteriaceae bacterium]
MNHGVYITQQGTSVTTPVVAECSIPFVVGTAPVQAAENPAGVSTPVLCTTWSEAVEKLGYSDDWEKYTLCEFMYSHYKLFAMQPVIFCNLLDPASMKESVSNAELDITNHKGLLPITAINDENLVVMNSLTQLEPEIDYSAYYSGENLVIELLEDGSAYSVTDLSVSYNQVTPDSVTSNDVAAAFEVAEACLTTVGTIPDLLVAPGFSQISTVAAAMAAKASSINGLFEAKAIIDIDSSADGATNYTDAIELKTKNNLTDSYEIVCWPQLKNGDYKFHMSTQLAGLMAQVDADNDNCPYESPSNKNLKCDSLVLDDGTEVQLTLTQANNLNSNGIVTGLYFINGWVAWGNTTACYPANTDVKDYFIPVSRMFGWVGSTLVQTFWSKLDKPMNRRLIENVLDTTNIWLNGLVGTGRLLGARVEMFEDENPLTNLMAGIIKLHVFMTPPSPAQEIDFVLEYDADYVESALQG